MKLALLIISTVSLGGQTGQTKPVITSIVNAASLYQPPIDDDELGLGVAGGSIITIFGKNLSRSTMDSGGFPLPHKLEDTTVTIGDIAAPLFFVSPTQIKAMVPSALGLHKYGHPRGLFRTANVVVHAGESMTEPYKLRVTPRGLGIFTTGSTGCGQGLIYQENPDGSITLNGPNNSADPGKTVLTVVYTGNGIVAAGFPIPPDGEPTPDKGLPTTEGIPFLAEIFNEYQQLFDGWPDIKDSGATGGRLPRTVGTDFTTFRLPDRVPEGCAVPLRLFAQHTTSQNVTISVKKGGGRCVEPPVESIALLTWERTTTSGVESEAVTSELRIEFLASPGKSLPVRQVLPEDFNQATWVELEGPSCPLPADTKLDAGEMTATGPDWGPLTIKPDDANTYRIAIPPNAVREGTFTIRGSGGKDVGRFETTIRIPSPIEPAAYPPGTQIPAFLRAGGTPRFEWKGGDDASWVRVGVLSRPTDANRGDWLREGDARASKGHLWLTVLEFFGLIPAPEAELLFTQDAVTPITFEAPGLTRGGLHRWIYKWRFTGLVVTEKWIGPPYTPY